MNKFLISLAVSLAVVACNEQKPAAQAQGQMPPPKVGFVTMKLETAEITSELAGRVVPSLIAEVRPQVSGIIEKRLFSEGSEVKEGDVLYQIAAASYQAAEASARAALDRAKAAQTAAQSRADRYQTLASQAIASQQDRETAISNAQQAKADVAAASAALEAATINLGYTKVRAPISGRIGVSSLTEGALVTANQPTALATIQALDPVFVDAPLSAADLLQTRAEVQSGRLVVPEEGAHLRLMLDTGQVYAREGVLKFADVTVNQGTGTVTLRATFGNPERLLLPNMFVRGTAMVGQRKDVILAPQRAVSRDPRGQATALVIGEGNKIEPRLLEVGRSVGNNWIVEKGLAAGDRLVMDGVQRVRPGMVVTPEPFAPGNAAAPASAEAPKTR